MATEAKVETDDSGIPRQVMEQAALAEEFMATLSGEDNADDNKEVAEDQDEEQEETDSTEDEDLDTESQEEEAEEDDEEEDEAWEQKYKTLQGKYSAEVPLLQSELKELKNSIIERLGTLSPETPAAKEEQGEDELFSSEEEEEIKDRFGDDIFDILNKVVERKTKSLLDESLAPVSSKVDSVENTQIETAQSSFKSDLTEAVKGDWEKLWSGEDEGFIEFLKEPDPSGFFTYGEIAKMANDNWDVDKFSKVFNAYIERNAKPEKKTRVAEQKTDNARIAPERKSSATVPDADEPMIWTQASIKEFQENDRKGKYSEDESKSLWNDLLSAPAQNRIQN